LTFHLDAPPATETSHPGSRATSYFVHGNLVSAADLPDARHVDHWYQISAIDVLSDSKAASVVVLGDSITDGHGATTNGNDRWTDVLAHACRVRMIRAMSEYPTKELAAIIF
jgi:2-keto-4-pentenoate hydratase